LACPQFILKNFLIFKTFYANKSSNLLELLINYQNNRYKKLELIINLRKKCICMLFILKFVGKYKYKINKVFLLVLSKLVCYNKALKHIAYYENKCIQKI